MANQIPTTTKEERAEEISAGESGCQEGDKETKVNDEILPGVPQRQSRGKRVLGAGKNAEQRPVEWKSALDNLKDEWDTLITSRWDATEMEEGTADQIGLYY